MKNAGLSSKKSDSQAFFLNIVEILSPALCLETAYPVIEKVAKVIPQVYQHLFTDLAYQVEIDILFKAPKGLPHA